MESEAIPTEPRAAARAAGLRYVSDRLPGISRRRAGRAFSYAGPDGSRITSAEELRRIRSLVIPPAWTDVWICPVPNGHLQATGRDARGRKQYRYHPAWREQRDRTKYGRLAAFARILPIIRARVERDLSAPGHSKEKVVATVVRLLEETLVRIGNEEYARENRSYGLTTLRDQHARIEGASLTFRFRGKSGKEHCIGLKNRRLSRIVKQCQELPGQELFQYVNGDGEPTPIRSDDVNDYLKEITGEAFTAKDFRTWAGTLAAALALLKYGVPGSVTEARSNVVQTVKEVAHRLGNTPATCRKYYIHPVVIEAYLDGALPQLMRPLAQAATESSAGELQRHEISLLAMLEREVEFQ